MDTAGPEPDAEQLSDTGDQSPVDPNKHQPVNLMPAYPAQKRKKYLFIVLFILLLAVLGFGAYKLSSRKPTPKQPETSNTQTQPTTSTTSEKDVPDVSDTKSYENGFLAVKLNYPSNWTATENDNKDTVRLESPDFSYQTLSKGTVTGNFRVTVRKGARPEDDKYIGRGYAFQPSEKLTYTNPAPGQLTETYLSQFGLDTPDNFAFFLIAGNYNLKQGDTLGPNYGKEPETYIIAGGFSSKDQKEDLATNTVSSEMIKTSNAYKQAISILKSLQLR